MTKIIWIIVLFLGVPSTIYFCVNDALTSQESQWYQAVLKDLPTEKQSLYTLQAACYDPTVLTKVDLSQVCTPYKNTRRLRIVALGAAVIPVVYSILLLLLSLKCRTDRNLLLTVFRPGVYASTGLVAALILLQWFLVSGVIYGYSFGELHGEQYFWIVLLGCVSMVGAFFTMKPLLTGFPKASTTVLGLKLEESEHPTIWKLVRELAAKAEANIPDHIIVGFTPNFFVTEATVICASGTFEGATMYLSLPLCRILNTQELAAVILHELAHFKGDDARFTIDFYPIYRGISASIVGVSNASARVMKIGDYVPFAAWRIIFAIAGLSLLPSVYLLSFFFDAFSRPESLIGRDRELSADALASRVESASAIASVLVKISAYTGIWYELIEWAKESRATGIVTFGDKSYEARSCFYNMSQLYAAMVADKVDPSLLRNLDLVKTPHPTDTHPPLNIRLNALGTPIESVAALALLVESDQQSSLLFERLEELEVQISDLQWELGLA